MKKINSLKNPEIKHIVKLHNNKYRKEYNQSIVEGQRAVQTFLNSKIKIINIYITESNSELIKNLNIKYTVVPEFIMQKISTQKTPPGILAIFNIPANPNWEELSSGIVLLELSNPGNMGTLIRTAVAVGAKTIVSIDSLDIWSPKVIQSTAGNIAQAKIFITSWNTLIKNKKDIELYGLVISNGQDVSTIKTNKSLIIIGNEASGINFKYFNQIDKLITLPMPGGSESLNAAVAGSIALYIAYIYK